MIPNVLSIAGSDPSGGAGIQADLKTFAAHRAYGCAVLTGLTAQNTRGVSAVHEVPAAFVREQLRVLFEDVQIHALKTGMLGSEALIEAVVLGLRDAPTERVVVDPVMVAKSGHHLLPREAVDALRRELLPRAWLLTPNLPEAAVLLDRPEPRSLDEMRAAARALLALGPRAVLLKGGHLTGPESVDVFCDGERLEVLSAPRIDTKNTHGTGCTLSAAITAQLGHGVELLEAVRRAKMYLSGAIEHAGELDVGRGHGPVHHAWWSSEL